VKTKNEWVLHTPFRRLVVNLLHTGKFHWSVETISGNQLSSSPEKFDSFLECVRDYDMRYKAAIDLLLEVRGK